MMLVRRDAILAAGAAIIGAGFLAYLSWPYALAVGAAVFIGIKALVSGGLGAVLRGAKGGLCADCGGPAGKCECLQGS